MFDGHWRSPIEQGLAPIGRGLRRAGISADVITVAGLVMSCATAVAIGTGHFRLAFLFLLLTGIPDALDGAVAKAAGTSSTRGAFFDSVADRVTDAMLFFGIAWWFAEDRGGTIVLLPFAAFAVASLVSYQRAKAESLGLQAKGGIMERAERVIVLGLGLLFPEFLVGVLWVLLTLTALTAVQRFVKVWRQADRPPRVRPTRRRRTRRQNRRTRSSTWANGAWSAERRAERRRNRPTSTD
ncbi:MAG: CDP-alcohol phosphatidyltransferase family protein [Actinomycetota bacterium]|nr:CDP-alcohol phosphatidyltransferase family protein [Actinomycetota bacterium]